MAVQTIYESQTKRSPEYLEMENLSKDFFFLCFNTLQVTERGNFISFYFICGI